MDNSKQIATGIVAPPSLGLGYWAANYSTIDYTYEDLFYLVSASCIVLVVGLNIIADEMRLILRDGANIPAFAEKVHSRYRPYVILPAEP